MPCDQSTSSSALHKAAFFDVDNTLLRLKSMFSFQEFYLDVWKAGQGGAAESYADFLSRFESHPERDDRAALNRFFYQRYAGHAQEDVLAAALAWFDSVQVAEGDDLWIKPALMLARQLRCEGHRLVAVSGSSHEILAPVVRRLGFDHCLATRLQTCEGVFTGEILAPQMIGPGKAEAMRRFAQEHHVDLSLSVACGDHITDLPMLEAAGGAFVVAGDAALEAIAYARGWTVLQTESSAMHDRHLAHV